MFAIKVKPSPRSIFREILPKSAGTWLSSVKTPSSTQIFLTIHFVIPKIGNVLGRQLKTELGQNMVIEVTRTI